jgi:macrolide-specific efflux system membrane fusion protein
MVQLYSPSPNWLRTKSGSLIAMRILPGLLGTLLPRFCLIHSELTGILTISLPVSLYISFMNKSRIRILAVNFVILLAVVGVGYWGYGALHPKAAEVSLQTVTVARGDVLSTVSASGTVISPSDLGLAPTTGGTLAALYVKVGDSVQPGQKLAQLDTSSLKSAVTQAGQSLTTAKNSLAISALQIQNDQQAVSNAQANVTYQQTQITASEASDQQAVSNAQANVTYQQTQITASEASDQQSIATAQANLDYQRTLITASEATDQLAITNAQNTAANDAATAAQNAIAYQASVDSAKKALDDATANSVLAAKSYQANVDGTALNYDNYLGLYGPAGITVSFCTTNNTVNANCTQLMSYYTAWQSALSSQTASLLKDQQNLANLNAAYSNSLLTQKQKLAADAQLAVNDRLAISNAKSTADLNLKKNQQTITNAQQAVSTAATTADTNHKKNQQSLITAKQAVSTAATTADTNHKKNQQSLITAQQSVTAAQNTLKTYETQNGMSSPTDINAVAVGQIAVAQAAFDQAQRNLSGATVVAPAAGKVASISSVVGGNVNTNTTPPTANANATGFIVLTDVGALQVTAGFSESDVAKISMGQSASISFAALPNVSAPATVTNIALLPTTSSGATSYTVTFQLSAPVNGLKPGMTATVTVTVGESLNAISVTSRAVTTRGSGSTVNLVKTVGGKQVQTRTRVIVGLTGDSADEILSGLKVGDKVALPAIGGTVGSNGFPTITGVPGALGGAGLSGGGGGGGGRGGGGGFGG